MPECTTIRVRHRKLCAGDLDRRITISSRTLDAPTTTVDFEHTFTDVGSKKWAALKTTRGREMFFATNMGVAVSHIFYVRWYDGLTSENWITFKGERYDIVEVEDIDERNEWYAIYCNVRGDETQDQNDA